MIRPTWQFDGPEEDEPAGTPPTPLASLHFLMTALRRRWRLWVGLGLAGLLLGAAAAMAFPSQSRSEFTLILAHPAGADPTQEITTDISLLRTRSVANDVIETLDLEMTPDELQDAVTITQLSSTILTVTVAAPDRAAAHELAEALATSFLEFRTDQMEQQAEALSSGYGDRIENLRSEIADITARYEMIDERDAGGRARASDLLTRRSQLSAEIDDLQQTVEQSTIETASLVAASHVLDPPSTVPAAGARRTALAGASGGIGGAALGIALVFFTALTSDKLRRREDVALALGVPVRYSVPRGGARIASADGGSAPMKAHDLLGRAIAAACSDRRTGPRRLALGAIDDLRDCEAVTAALIFALSRSGTSVFVADLSSRGRLARLLGIAFAGGSGGPAVVPTVIRPEEAMLARGPGLPPPEKSSVGPEVEAVWRTADVVVVLVDVDSGVGVDQVPTWADEMIPVVTAGRSSAERLRTSVELIRSSGLELPFAVMVGADGFDESYGRLGDAGSPASTARRGAR